MCNECGCNSPSTGSVGPSGGAHPHPHEHGPGHHHPHDHSQGEDRSDAAPAGGKRVLEIRRPVLEKNDRQAERNRRFFETHGLFVMNVLSSPGSGKTTFLRETIKLLGADLRTGVVVGDLATDNDARRLREAGGPVVQVNTGTMCHLEAGMVLRAVKQLDLAGVGLLIVENVGNLVCPASYDLGEHLRIVLLSVAEGEDKPLKYPPVFRMADVVVISKMDLAGPCGCDLDELRGNVSRAAPGARKFEVSAKTGQGMAAWRDFVLAARSERLKA